MKRVALLCLLAGCLRSTEYRCSNSGDCSGGVCQSVGYCSFADSSCSSGQRFDDSAGSYANTCVGSNPGQDGGMGDARPPDGGGACPASYSALNGGQGNHVYRALGGMGATWDTQRTACAADGANAYLVIPDDAAELTAISTLGGQSQTFWVGITDAQTEGTFLTVKGAAATFLPWQMGQPNNTGNSDCVEANRFQQTFNDRTCDTFERAICECEP